MAATDSIGLSAKRPCNWAANLSIVYPNLSEISYILYNAQFNVLFGRMSAGGNF